MFDEKKPGVKSDDLRFEELMLREKKSRKFSQDVADFNDETRAIDLAEANGDEDVTSTLNGKMITGRVARRSHHHDLRAIFSAGGFIGATKSIASGLLDLAMTGLLYGGSRQSPSESMSSHFVDTASQRSSALQPAHEDEDFIYDVMNVSRPVYDKLMKESELIAKKLEEAEILPAGPARDEKFKAVEKLAEEFDMRLHPLTKVYVHDYNRVLREEKLCGADLQVKQQDMHLHVCIFRAKAELSDLRGIKSKVADQYDQTPEEVQVSGDHLKGTAPALVPNGP